MNFTLAKYFMYMFPIIFIIFYVSEVSAVPAISTYALLNSFLLFLNKENCRMPSAIDLPFDVQHEETSPWNFLSIPLHSCETVDNVNSKIPYTLCTEIFDAVANVSCSPINEQNIQLPNIKIEISTDVCRDFNKMEDIFSENPDYIGKKLAADKVICKLICSGQEMNNACRFLLWIYEVQKQVSDYLENVNNASFHHNPVVFNDNNEIHDSAKLEPEEVIKIPNKDPNNSDLQGPAEVKTVVDFHHADIPNEPNVQASNEKNIETEPAKKPSNNDDEKEQKPDLENENTQPMTKIDIVDEALIHNGEDNNEEQQGHKDLKDTNKENEKGQDNKAPDSEIAVQPVENVVVKPSLVIDDQLSKTEQDSNGEKNSSDFAPTTSNITINAKLGTSTTKPSSQTTTKTQSSNNLDNQKQTPAGIDLKTTTNDDAKSNVKKENELSEGNESDNKIVTDISRVSESVPSEIPTADDKENIIPDTPEITKANPNADEFSNNLPEDDAASLYDKKQGSSLIPDANKEPKLSNELPNSFDKPEDKSDILLDREQEPNIDMESDFGESEFPSQDNGRSPVERIQVIPMSQGIFPEQDDSHFFFYFLTIIFIVMAGYLIFHNKQKIIALIVEGRHERRRRSHGVGYKKLDTK